MVADVDGAKQGDGRRKGGWKAADVEEIQDYLDSPAPATVLALVAEDLKASSALWKTCAKAGEVLASGTWASGSLAESWGRTGTLTPPPLQVGDVVEMTIEAIGTIRNAVVTGTEDVPAVPTARRRSVEAV